MISFQRAPRPTPQPTEVAPKLTLIERVRGQLQRAGQEVARAVEAPLNWLSSLGFRPRLESQAEKTQVAIKTHRSFAPAVAAVLLGITFAQGTGLATQNTPAGPAVAPTVNVVEVAAPVPAPAPAPLPTHIVRRGESLWTIGKRFHVSEGQLRALNPGINRRGLIFPGQELNLPATVQVPKPVSERGRVLPAPIEITPPVSEVERPVEERPLVRVGSRGGDVAYLEHRLQHLGYPTGPADGRFDDRLRRAVRSFQLANGLHVDGAVGAATWPKVAAPDAVRFSLPEFPQLARYRPGSADSLALFTAATRYLGVPEDWAKTKALERLLGSESGGWVGRPNYTYGARYLDHARWGEVQAELKRGRITARSSATGLGQLLLSNVDKYYPSGRAGIGDPLEEAIGMLAYIEDRYGSPQRAWQLYNRLHEGY